MKISVLREEGLPKRFLNVDSERMFADVSGITLVFQNVADLLGNGVRGDVFFNEHGEIYPIAIEDTLYSFFQAGGGLLHIGGAPFETAMRFEDSGWREQIRTLGDSRDHKGYGPLDVTFDHFRAKLGFTPYQPAFRSDNYDDCLLVLDEKLVGAEALKGVTHDRCANLANSPQMRMFQPYLDLNDHRAYQARPALRETVYAGTLVAPDGTELARSLQYVKSWGNPYTKRQDRPMRPWVLLYARVDTPLPAYLVQSICSWLDAPVFLKPTELPLASLHPGESTQVSVPLTGSLPRGWRVKVLTARVNKQQLIGHEEYDYQETVCELENAAVRSTIEYMPDALLVALRFELYDDKGVLRDFTESGISMWNPDALCSSATVETNGCYFNLKSERILVESGWIPGTNWQDRHLFSLSFHNPNPLRIAGDALQMAETGMVFVRPHYFMPGWFRVVPGKVFEDEFGDFFDSFEEGPLLSERHMRALEAHIMIFCSLGLVFMPSVFTNIGRCMGSPSHWMGTARLFAIRYHIDCQKQFARQLMDRFGKVPAISWDLINEPDTSMDIAGKWLEEHRTIWGESGQTVSLGAMNKHDNLLLGESADWHSQHGQSLPVFRSGKPYLLHEAHYPVPSTYDGEDELEEYLSRAFANTIRDGGCSIMPWNWNMSFQNWRYRGGWVDFWDLHLGICTHADGTVRRGMSIMRNWHNLLQGLRFDQSLHRQVLYVYPKTTLRGIGSFEYMEILERKGIPFLGINDKDFENCDLSNAKLVIFPLYGAGYRDESWERAKKFAKEGGTVWAHNENLAMNENGEPRPKRGVPEKGCGQEIGKGRIHWCLGWNYDRNLGQDYPDMIVLAALMDTLGLKSIPTGTLPLEDGQMQIHQRWTSGRCAMKYDWLSNAPLPDAYDATGLEVRDKDGRVVKAWNDGSHTVSVDGYTFSSPGQLFILREKSGLYYANAHDLQVSGHFGKPNVSLVKNYNYHGDWVVVPGIAKEFKVADGIRYLMDGWKRQCWLRLEMENDK